MERVSTPNMYDVHLEDSKLEDLLEVYSKDILTTATTAQVEKAMVEYANTLVEPTGWNGVWRSTPSSSHLDSDADFLVEVRDVSMSELQSRVLVTKVLPASAETINDEALSLVGDVLLVPLVELYPVSEGDGEEDFLRTAVAIEYIRFFYQNLWRPWDEEEDDNFIFAEKNLRPRLKFFFDVKNKRISESISTRAAQILKESWVLRAKLENLQEMQASDSDAEVGEDELAQSVKVHLQLGILQRELEIIENPVVRGLLLNDHTTHPRGPIQDRDYPITHVVGDKVTLKMLKELSLDENTVIAVRQLLDEALMWALDGDTILVCPGIYRCEILSWVEHDVTIQGIGGSEDVVFESSSCCGDIFFNFATSHVKISNLTLRTENGMKATVLVHRGHLTIESCNLTGLALSHLLILGEAKVVVSGCTIQNAEEDGIQVRVGAHLSIESSSIQNCCGSGIKLEGSPQYGIFKTRLNLRNVQCLDNQNFGITLDTESCHPEPQLTWEEIMNIPWLNIEVENVSCLRNGQGPLGFTPSPVASPPKEYEKFLNSVAHHVQSLSVSDQSCLNVSGNTNQSSDGMILSLSSSDEGECFECPAVNLNKTLTKPLLDESVESTP